MTLFLMWLGGVLLIWAVLFVGTDGDDDGYRQQPRRRWRCPFRLTPSEREYNRHRYGRIA